MFTLDPAPPTYTAAVRAALSRGRRFTDVDPDERAVNATAWYLMTVNAEGSGHAYMFPPARLQAPRFPTIPETTLIRHLYNHTVWMLQLASADEASTT